MTYSSIVEKTCRRLRDYAQKSASKCGYRSPFNALLLLAGDPYVLKEGRMYRMIPREPGVQMVLDDFSGKQIDDPDIFWLFDYMNEKTRENGDAKRGHKDGAIIFDHNGRVVRAGVRVTGYPEFDDMDDLYKRIMGIKQGDEVGTRHIAAAHSSYVQGVDVALALSESAGTMIPFVGGEIAEEFVYSPHSRLQIPEEHTDVAEPQHSVSEMHSRQPLDWELFLPNRYLQ